MQLRMDSSLPLAVLRLNCISDCITQKESFDASFLETFRQSPRKTEDPGFCVTKCLCIPNCPFDPKKEVFHATKYLLRGFASNHCAVPTVPHSAQRNLQSQHNLSQTK